MKVQSIYTSKILKRGLEFAASNGTLFAATATLGFSVLRPLVILAAPKTDKESRRIASIKSIASTLTGYLMMLGVSVPVARAVKKIDENPAKYLNSSTVKHLQIGEKSLLESSKYSFATQLIKLGLGAVAAIPKSILTCAMIPVLMSAINKHQKNTNTQGQKPSFTGGGTQMIGRNVKISCRNLYDNGVECLAKKFGGFINSKFVHRLTDKFNDKNYEQHIISIADSAATAAFIAQTARNKKIKDNEKKLLIYNSVISTGLSLGGMYAIEGLTKQSTEKFIEKFKIANANAPKLSKYVEGIRIVKPLITLGLLYYLVIPLLSIFFADKFVKNDK